MRSIPTLVLFLLSLIAGERMVGAKVTLGNMILRDDDFSALKGHRVAALTNPTGVFMDTMNHIVDEMKASPNVDIVAVFGPEHGFRGDLQAETGDPLFYIDNATMLPVFSAYNMSSMELCSVMSRMNITMVVVDMQDVGVRLYTFIWTMYDVMEGAKLCFSNEQHSTSILVLDRPNPLGGVQVGGPLLHMAERSGYGKYPITHVHGMTIGELSILFNEAIQLPRNEVHFLLEVVQMTGWKRHMTWYDTALPWVPPSPNLPSVQSAIAYGATVFLEATSVSEGRGTTTPFLLFGAPFLDAEMLASRLNLDFELSSKQAAFRAAFYEPSFSKYNGTTVPGVQWLPERTSSEYDVFLSGTLVLCAVRDLASPPEDFVWDGVWFGHPGTELIDQYAGTPTYRKMLDNKKMSAQDIVSYFAKDKSDFEQMRRKFMLYGI